MINRPPTHQVVEGVALARAELGGHFPVDFGGGVGRLGVEATGPVLLVCSLLSCAAYIYIILIYI